MTALGLRRGIAVLSPALVSLAETLFAEMGADPGLDDAVSGPDVFSECLVRCDPAVYEWRVWLGDDYCVLTISWESICGR